MYMTLPQIAASAGAIGNQVSAGIPLDQALARMARLQPSFAEFWKRATETIKSGAPLSSVIDEVWPGQLVAVVRSGEEAGRIAEVFQRIEETVELQLQLKGKMMKLGYPVGMGAAGFLVFLGFMTFVLPALGSSLKKENPGLIFQASLIMSEFVKANWMVVAGGFAFAVIALIKWAQTEQAKEAVLGFLLKVPVVKDALRDMYFGLWGQYLGMMVGSGITMVDALKSTAAVLPPMLAESVREFERDLSVNNKGMADSADFERMELDDPRAKWWPFYISNAFIVAEQTGDVPKELSRSCPILIKEGIKTLERFISVLNTATLAVSAFLIVSPMAAYYMEIFSTIGNMR